MAKPVVHFEVWSHEHKKLCEFYAKLFDWKVDFNNPMNYGVVDAGGATTGGKVGINGGIMKPQPGSIPASHLTF